MTYLNGFDVPDYMYHPEKGQKLPVNYCRMIRTKTYHFLQGSVDGFKFFNISMRNVEEFHND